MMIKKAKESPDSSALSPAPDTVAQPDITVGKTEAVTEKAKESPDSSALSPAPDPDARINEIRHNIDEYYVAIPKRLRDYPDAQTKCLELLAAAEETLTPPVVRKDLIGSRLTLTRLEIEMIRAESSKTSFFIVVAIIYIFSVLSGLAISFDVIDFSSDPEVLNQTLVMGIPQPIWVWSVIGSFTSMLFRAGNFPFASKNEAIRWLLFRPIVGVVMGVMIYLMLIAGLIVFSGSGTPQTPQLLWIIAFLGGFSDTLSVKLLQTLIGKFEVEKPIPNTPNTTNNPSQGKSTTD